MSSCDTDAALFGSGDEDAMQMVSRGGSQLPPENERGERFVWSTPAAARNIVLTALSKAGIRTGYRKIFAIGLSKTATTSIHQVFVESGLHAIHGLRGKHLWRRMAIWPWEALSDQTANGFRRLDRRFPESLFILNTRDLVPWLDSRLRHIAIGPPETLGGRLEQHGCRRGGGNPQSRKAPCGSPGALCPASREALGGQLCA